jgi:hypothetical protein
MVGKVVMAQELARLQVNATVPAGTALRCLMLFMHSPHSTSDHV